MTRLSRKNLAIAAVAAITIASLGVAIFVTTTKATTSATATSSVSSSSSSITTIYLSTSTGTSVKSSTNSFTSSSTYTSSSASTSISLSDESLNNTCISHSYNSSISTINAIYYECSAALNSEQSYKEFVIRSAQLNGNFELSVNGSQSIQVQVIVNGTTVYSQAGTTLEYSGNAAEGDLMSVTVTNSESSITTYELGLDWTSA